MKHGSKSSCAPCFQHVLSGPLLSSSDSWSGPSHVKITELVPWPLHANLYAFFLRVRAAKEKCLLFLSYYSHWNELKIIFRQQLLIITEKAFYGYTARALFVSETVTHQLTASFPTLSVLIFLPSIAFLSMPDTTPITCPFLVS